MISYKQNGMPVTTETDLGTQEKDGVYHIIPQIQTDSAKESWFTQRSRRPLRPSDLIGFGVPPDVAIVLGLVDDAVEALEGIRAGLREDSRLVVDDQFSKLALLIRELFSFRNISTGYGMVVSAMLSAVQQVDTNQLMAAHTDAFVECLEAIRLEPYMEDMKALDLCDRLEGVDLPTFPEGFDEFSNVIDELPD